jgi:mxaJ protein
MFSASKFLAGLVAGVLFGALAAVADRAVLRGETVPSLRICADPNNLPYSNRAGQGFENKLAAIVARELRRPLAYVWQPQRRGFLRTTLNAGRCDVVMGLTPGAGAVLTSRPYYRSSYMFVRRHEEARALTSTADPRLARARLGIQITGMDYDNPPPAQAFALSGLAANVRGFPVYGDFNRPEPLRAIVDAVARNEIDVAAVWGPVAGYFAAREPVALDLTPMSTPAGDPAVTFVFDIAVGVRCGNGALRTAIDAVLARRRTEVRSLLAQYGVPQFDVPARTLAIDRPCGASGSGTGEMP